MRGNPYSLSAALRVCHQCEAVSPSREWRLLDRVGESRSRPGMEVLVRMNGIPATDSRGRIAHLRGLYVHCQADYDITDVTNDAVTAYDLRGIFPSVFLRDVTGWEFLSDIDARTILDDQYFRFGSLLNWPVLQSGVQDLNLPAQPAPPVNITAEEGIAANAGVVANANVNLSWYLPLTGPSKHALRGLIPLASLQRVSNNALTIRIGQTFPNVPANVTFNGPVVIDEIAGVTRPGLDIWADIVWLDALVVDAPWMLDEYTLTERTGVLLHPERVSEYVWMRFFPEDDLQNPGLGQTLVQGYDGITLTIAGFTIKSGQLIDDAVHDMYMDEMSRWDGSLSRLNAGQSLPIGDINVGQRALSLLPYRHRQQAAAGPVNYRFSQQSNTDFTRFVHRTVACHTADRAKMLESKLNCGPCGVRGTMYDGKPCKSVSSYEPVIVMPRRQLRRMRQQG